MIVLVFLTILSAIQTIFILHILDKKAVERASVPATCGIQELLILIDVLKFHCVNV